MKQKCKLCDKAIDRRSDLYCARCDKIVGDVNAGMAAELAD